MKPLLIATIVAPFIVPLAAQAAEPSSTDASTYQGLGKDNPALTGDSTFTPGEVRAGGPSEPSGDTSPYTGTNTTTYHGLANDNPELKGREPFTPGDVRTSGN